jgi:glutaconate CoA-transferase, subunit A
MDQALHGESVDTIEALARAIPDGSSVAIPKDDSGGSIAAVAALAARGARGLRVLCVPTGGLQADLLLGAGAAAAVESAGISLGELGPAPRFQAAVAAHAFVMLDSTCPAIYAALQAAEKGQPFVPLRGLIGSDVLAHRIDWKTIQNPYAESDDPIVIMPAIAPDVALFHAPFADRHGNVYIGRQRELAVMAHAARRTLVTVEHVCGFDLLADPAHAPGTLPAIYVDAVVVAAGGAKPLGLPGHYEPDETAIAAYAAAARSREGFETWLAEYLRERPVAA